MCKRGGESFEVFSNENRFNSQKKKKKNEMKRLIASKLITPKK